MKFEHLVEINDLLNPLVESLTRAALWNGLLRSVEDPGAFIDALDEAKILERRSDGMERELRFGCTVIRDHVRLVPGREIEIRTDATPIIPAARRDVRIEEPAPGELFVRFTYEQFPQGHPPLTPEVAQALKSAWLQADRDLIARVRLLATDLPPQ